MIDDEAGRIRVFKLKLECLILDEMQFTITDQYVRCYCELVEVGLFYQKGDLPT